MFFRLQITNIINYLTPLKTIRYTVVIHPLQKKQHLHQHHNTHPNSDHLDHCLVSPSVNFCHGSQLSPLQQGVEDHLLGGGSNESIDGLWPATGGCPRSACGYHQQPNDGHETPKRTDIEGESTARQWTTLRLSCKYVGHVICKIILISPYIRNTYHASPHIFCSKYQDSGTHVTFYSVAPGHALML